MKFRNELLVLMIVIISAATIMSEMESLLSNIDSGNNVENIVKIENELAQTSKRTATGGTVHRV